MSKQGAVGKQKHITLTIQQLLDIIIRVGSGENQREVMASHSVGWSTDCDVKERKD
jgi:hypothetical protein